MPSLAESFGVGERALRIFQETGRNSVAHVHVGSARDHPDAQVFGGLEDAVVIVGGAEVQSCRGASREQLGDAQSGRGGDAVAVESRLVGQGSTVEPLEKGQAVRLVAQQRLDDMDVALDQTGDHRGVTCIKFGRRRDGTGTSGKDLGDSTATDQDVPFEPVPIPLHWDDGSTADQKVGAHLSIVQGVH